MLIARKSHDTLAGMLYFRPFLACQANPDMHRSYLSQGSLNQQRIYCVIGRSGGLEYDSRYVVIDCLQIINSVSSLFPTKSKKVCSFPDNKKRTFLPVLCNVARLHATQLFSPLRPEQQAFSTIHCKNKHQICWKNGAGVDETDTSTRQREEPRIFTTQGHHAFSPATSVAIYHRPDEGEDITIPYFPTSMPPYSGGVPFQKRSVQTSA